MSYQSVGVAGMVESGKSHELAKLARKVPRLVLFDPTADSNNFSWVPNEVSSPEELDGFFAQVRGEKAWALRYIPESETDKELAEEFGEVSRAVFEQGDCVFAVDELSQVAQYGQMPGAFSRIVRQGRHQGVDLAWSSQRVAEIPVSVRAQVRLWFLFCQRDPLDLKAVGERCGPEVEDRVSKLALRELVAFDMISGQIIPEEEAVRRFAHAVQTKPLVFKEKEAEQPSERWWKRHRFVLRG